MQFAHAGNQRLAGIGFGANAEGRVLLRELGHRHAHFFLIGLGLRLDGDRNHRRGEFDSFENDGLIFVAQRVAGGHTLQAHYRGDITRVNGFDFFALVGVHAQQPAHALARVLRRVVNIAPGIEFAGIDADVRDVANERVGHNLERQRGKGLIIRGAAQHAFAILRLPLNGRNIERRRKVIHHGIEQRLHTLILKSCAGNYRHQLQIDGRAADRSAQLFRGKIMLFQILVQHRVIVFRDVFHNLVAMLGVKSLVNRGSL